MADSTMPSIEQMVSRYLFNTDTPPANLEDESLIVDSRFVRLSCGLAAGMTGQSL